MKKIFEILACAIFIFFAIGAVAAEKVVVIPLSSKTSLDKSCLDPSITTDSQGDWILVCRTKTIFISSTTHIGNIGGLAGADAQCNALARAAGLQGTFKAWLSTPEKDVLTRFNWHSDNVYRDMQGNIVATSPTDLLDGSISSKPTYDENEISHWKEENYWSCTNSDGTYVGGGIYCCMNWTSVTTTATCITSDASFADCPNPTYCHECTCDLPHRIICIEQ